METLKISPVHFKSKCYLIAGAHSLKIMCNVTYYNTTTNTPCFSSFPAILHDRRFGHGATRQFETRECSEMTMLQPLRENREYTAAFKSHNNCSPLLDEKWIPRTAHGSVELKSQSIQDYGFTVWRRGNKTQQRTKRVYATYEYWTKGRCPNFQFKGPYAYMIDIKN